MTVADTNVLVHATVDTAPDHTRAFAALDREMRAGLVVISRQVLREYLAVMTRPQAWTTPLHLRDAIGLADRLADRFRVLEDGPLVWEELRTLAQGHAFGGKQVHDANIVATMRAHGETRLLTFNTKDFRRFEPAIQVIAP